VSRARDSGFTVVTGAFGYSGKYIASRLLAAGKRVRTLTNSPQRENPFGAAVEARPYHFERPDELARALEGADVLINTYPSHVTAVGPTTRHRADNSLTDQVARPAIRTTKS
jgi:NADH dehydrogenase